MRCFLQNALLTLNAVPAIGRILIISSDAEVLAMAREQGALTIAEKEAQGLNTAVTRATHYALCQRASGILILPADLPFMQTADIEAMTDKVDNGRVMAICTDKRQDGTNALLLAPPTHFTFHYGHGSFYQHLQEAVWLGYTPYIVTTPGLQFDLDTEADWRSYQEIAGVKGCGVR
jgi:2-phospho-L-lactate guanylyltransferase